MNWTPNIAIMYAAPPETSIQQPPPYPGGSSQAWAPPPSQSTISASGMQVDPASDSLFLNIGCPELLIILLWNSFSCIVGIR